MIRFVKWSLVAVLTLVSSGVFAQVEARGSGAFAPGGPPQAVRIDPAEARRRAEVLRRAAAERPQAVAPIKLPEPPSGHWESPNRLRDRYEKLAGPEDALANLQALEKIPDETKADSTLDFNFQWEQIGLGIAGGPTPDRSGRVSDASYNFDYSQGINALYVSGPNGGIWKAVLAGIIVVMVPIGDTLPNASVGAFAVHRLDSDIIIAGTGDWSRGPGTGLYRSEDGGQTWTNLAMPASSSWFSKIVSDVSDATGNTFLAASNAGIFRSTNGGRNWTRVFVGSVSDLVQDTTFPSYWYGGQVGQGLCRSTNSGLAWTTITTGVTAPVARMSVAYSQSQPQYVWLLAESVNGAFGGVFRSSNYGTSFTGIAGAPDTSGGSQAFHTGAITVNPSNHNEVYYGQAKLVKITNATQVSPTFSGFVNGGHDDYTTLFWNGTTLAIGNDGGFYTLSSSGSLNEAVNRAGLNLAESYNIYSTKADWTRSLAGLQDNGQVLIDTDASTKVRFFSGGDGGGGTISSDNSSRFYWSEGAYGPGYWYRFTTGDSGTTIAGLGEPNSDGINTVMNDPFPGFGNEVYTHSANRIYTRNPILGTAWTSITASDLPPVAGRTNFPTRYMDMAYGGVRGWYVLEWNTPAVYYVQEPIGAGTVSNRTPSDTGGGSVVFADRFVSDRVTFTNQALSPARAYISNNRGATWTPVHANLPAGTRASCLIVDPDWPNTYYMGTSFGMLRTDNAGVSWYRFNAGMPSGVPITMLNIVKDTLGLKYLRIASYGRGYWQRRLEQNVARTITFRLVLEESVKTNLTISSTFLNLDEPPVTATSSIFVPDTDHTYTWTGFGSNRMRIRIKGRSWLAKAYDVDLTNGNVNLGLIRLKNGDCDNDNAVSILDYLQLSADFDGQVGQPGVDPWSDLDGDTYVSILDYLILSANYELSGEEL